MGNFDMLNRYAQTNLQLYAQLRREGYSPAEIGSVAEAYELSRRLFACWYRPSGKTFIAHLVGTASILASLRTPASIVNAGLLHAAYANGDFGTGIYGVSDSKRKKLKQRVSAETEEYLARYAALLWWTEDNIRAVYRRVNDLDLIDRHVLLIRLANELEELLDYGWLYWSTLKGRQWYRDVIGGMVVEMAMKIGYPRLAGELQGHFNQCASSDIPAALRDQNSPVLMTASSMLPSRVIGLKPAPYVRQTANGLLNRFRNTRVAHPKILYWEVYGFMRRNLRSKQI